MHFVIVEGDSSEQKVSPNTQNYNKSNLDMIKAFITHIKSSNDTKKLRYFLNKNIPL